MATIQDQNKLLLPEKKIKEGKGGLDFVKAYAKDKKDEIKEKVTNIVEGIKATPAAIKKTFKKGKD